MRLDDLEVVLEVQEEGSVAALSHVFPQETNPFPRQLVRDRWERELVAADTDCFVVEGPGRAILGFAALRGAELLHLGTARDTWGSGLARRAHDELLDHLRRNGTRMARLWVFEDNGHARRFYEHRGWVATGTRTTSTFSPYPVLLEYEQALDPVRRITAETGPAAARRGCRPPARGSRGC